MNNRDNINNWVKLIMWPVGILLVIFLVCFMCDKLNITTLLPEKYNLFRNLDINNWISGIIAAVGSLISSFFVLFIAILQFVQQDENYKNDKRLQNKPAILYTVSENTYDNAPFIYAKEREGNMYGLGISLENIGLNHLKNLKIVISDNSGVLSIFPDDNSQVILKKDYKIFVNLLLQYNYLNKNKRHNYKKLLFNVSYDDMLNNHYKQEFCVEGSITERHTSGKYGYVFYVTKHYALPETMIKED